jgi:hypothetical protein
MYRALAKVFPLQAPASRQMRLGAGDQDKINAVLTDFSRICMSAILNNPDIQVNISSTILACSSLCV